VSASFFQLRLAEPEEQILDHFVDKSEPRSALLGFRHPRAVKMNPSTPRRPDHRGEAQNPLTLDIEGNCQRAAIGTPITLTSVYIVSHAQIAERGNANAYAPGARAGNRGVWLGTQGQNGSSVAKQTLDTRRDSYPIACSSRYWKARND